MSCILSYTCTVVPGGQLELASTMIDWIIKLKISHKTARYI